MGLSDLVTRVIKCSKIKVTKLVTTEVLFKAMGASGSQPAESTSLPSAARRWESIGLRRAQKTQYPLIKEYSLNYKWLHIMI